jgi:hypothetical protein
VQLGDLMRAGDGVFRAPTRPVAFKAIGRDGEGNRIVRDVAAVLEFVDEDDRETARIEAEKELRKSFPAGDPPADVLNDARAYRVLLLALRDADDPRKPFALSFPELRRSLHHLEARRIYLDYLDWCDLEFPSQIDDDQFDALVEEAKKKSFGDLLSSHDSLLIVRALPSLVARFGKSTTEQSGAGEPG